MRRLQIACAALALCMLVASLGAIAGDAQQAAEHHFDLGVEMYKDGDYAGALAEFIKAREASPHYAPLYNIGMCHLALQQYKDALEVFRRYLEEGGGDIPEERVEEVEERIVHIESNLCRVSLDVDVTGASILVDGEHAGTTPYAGVIFLDAGEHILRIEKDGHETWEREIVLSRGEKASYTIDLPAVEDEQVEEQEGQGGEEPAPSTAKEPPDEPGLEPLAFWTVMGSTAGVLAASAVTGGLVLARRSRYDGMDVEDDWRSFRSVTRRLAVATDVLWAVGGAGIVATVVLAFLTDFQPRKDEHTVQLELQPGRIGLLLGGRF